MFIHTGLHALTHAWAHSHGHTHRHTHILSWSNTQGMHTTKIYGTLNILNHTSKSNSAPLGTHKHHSFRSTQLHCQYQSNTITNEIHVEYVSQHIFHLLINVHLTSIKINGLQFLQGFVVETFCVSVFDGLASPWCQKRIKTVLALLLLAVLDNTRYSYAI